MRTVYYDHARADDPQPGFRSGDAGHVVLRPDGEIVWDRQVCIAANSAHALLHHGVIDDLNRLPIELGPIGTVRDAILPPASLESAAGILYEADRLTYGARFDIEVGARNTPEPVRYRLAIDNREYQRTLSRLQFLVTTAGRYGFGVRLRI